MAVIPFRDGEVRKLGDSELDVNITSPGNAVGIFQRLRNGMKQILHFLFGLQIELLGAEIQAGIFVYGVVGLNANQNFLYLRIFLFQVVHVISGHHGNAGFLAEPDYLRQNLQFFCHTMVLHFQKEVVMAKDGFIFQGCFLGPFVISG